MHSRLKPHTPRPLLTRAQLFQIRASGTFARLGDVNRRLQVLGEQLASHYRRVTTRLPDGYVLTPFEPEIARQEPWFVLADDCNNVIAWPVTAYEAGPKAWEWAGKPQPLLSEDCDYTKTQAAIAELEEARKAICAELDAIENGTPEPEVLWRSEARILGEELEEDDLPLFAPALI